MKNSIHSFREIAWKIFALGFKYCYLIFPKRLNGLNTIIFPVLMILLPSNEVSKSLFSNRVRLAFTGTTPGVIFYTYKGAIITAQCPLHNKTFHHHCPALSGAYQLLHLLISPVIKHWFFDIYFTEGIKNMTSVVQSHRHHKRHRLP